MAYYCGHGYLPGPPYNPVNAFPVYPFLAPVPAPVPQYQSQSGSEEYSDYDYGYDCDYDDDYECTGIQSGCDCDLCHNHNDAQHLLTAPLGPVLTHPNKQVRVLFRATVTNMPWDSFEWFTRPTDPFVQHRLWACSGKNSPLDWHWRDVDGHVLMGFDQSHRSEFISFTSSLEWAVYYQLKQEYVGGEARRLFQVQVPAEQTFEYRGRNDVAHDLSWCAYEVFAHRFTDVYVHHELAVRADVREFARAWFLGRKAAAKEKRRPVTYPFGKWSRDVWRVFGGWE